MKRITAAVVGFAMLCAGAPLAVAGAAPAASSAGGAAESAATHPHVMKMRSVTGHVVAVDQTARTLRLKPAASGSTEMTFSLEQGSKLSLTSLQPGERIRVSYIDRDGQLTASAITPLTHVASK